MNVTELVIIESLPETELQTGSELHKALAGAHGPTIPMKFIRLRAAGQLLNVIGQMRDQAKRVPGWVPVVHLEIHGDVHRRGLIMPSGELLPWGPLAVAFREVNIVVRNSVILVLGVCSGAFALTAAANSPFEPSPFYGVIGPDRPVIGYFLPHGFLAFYMTLFRTGDFVMAVNDLRQRTLPEYGGYDTATLFRMGRRQYAAYLYGEKLRKRVKRVVRRLPAGEVARYGGRNKARLAIARRIQDSGASWEAYYNHFIMADIYPENATRFPPIDAA